MPTRAPYDYAVIRVVPRVERGEFVNVGVMLACRAGGYLRAAIELDEARVLALAPGLDIDALRQHLAAFPAICAGGATAGPIGLLGQRARFEWLAAARSTVIQTSPVHTGRCIDPDAALERLLEQMVRTPVPRR